LDEIRAAQCCLLPNGAVTCAYLEFILSLLSGATDKFRLGSRNENRGEKKGESGKNLHGRVVSVHCDETRSVSFL
jgi:hypothetical protein